MISVLVTVFNSQNTISETMNSILNQSFSDFEIVIIDDGSTDSTGEIISSVKDNRVKYFNPGRLGRSAALNYGVAKCKYELVAICDSDDIWHHDKLNIQIKILNKFPKADLICTASQNFHTASLLKYKSGFDLEEIPVKEITYKNLLFKNKITHSSVLIKKNLLKYSEFRNSQIDYELWLRLAYEINIKIIQINYILTFHRIHSAQSFESRGFKYRLKSIFLVNEFALKSMNLSIFILNNLKIIYYIFSRLMVKYNSKILKN